MVAWYDVGDGIDIPVARWHRVVCAVRSALGANPVREKIWPRRFPQSIITTLRNVTEIETALVDLFWAHLPY